MSESIPIGLKRAAIVLAKELDYARAAEKLNTTSAELRKQISMLESQLYFHIFEPIRKEVKLTDEGEFLLRAFRESVALHDRKATIAQGESPCRWNK